MLVGVIMLTNEFRLSSVDNLSEQDLFSEIHIDMSFNEKDRVSRNSIYWDLYKGKHWTQEEQDDDQPTPTFNKVKIIVNKILSHLVGKPFAISYLNERIESLLAPFVNFILENSGGIECFGWEAAQMGSITGDCFLKPSYNESSKSVSLNVLDSSDTFVTYRFSDYRNNVPSDALIRWQFIDDDGKIAWKKQRWYKDRFYTVIDKKIVKDESGVNLLGKVPLVHIRNQIIGKEVYGLSDISDLESLNKLLNSRLRRFNDDVDYCGDPITIIFGARLSSLERGANKTWGGLPADAKVQNLTLDTDLPAQQRMIEYISGGIHESGNVPEDSVNGKKHMSNVSGTSYHYDQIPIIEAVDRKRLVYGKGFKSAIEMGLELLEICDRKYRLNLGLTNVKNEIEAELRKSNNPLSRLQKWNTVHTQFQEYFPKDKISELQALNMEINMGIESRAGAMKRLGRENIDFKLTEILRDRELFGKADKDVEPIGTNEIRSDLYKDSSPTKDKSGDGLEDKNDKE